MRFIVDLYRYIILGILALLIIGLVFGIIKLTTIDSSLYPLAGLYAVGGVGVLLSIVMLLGLTATFISIHDRHVELVEEIRQWREDFRS